jgi:hypothetical protein
MNPLDALREFLKPRDITVALPDSPFVAIDADKEADKLKLDKRADERGKSNLPPSDTTELDSVESEIVGEIAEQLNRAQIDGENHIKVYGQRLAELSLLRELSFVTGASETALGDYQTAIKVRRNRLANARDAIRESYEELQAFKTDHHLRRPAHDISSPVYTWSVIIISWILESLGNTAFLRVNDAFGLVGGFVAATVVAGVNVGTSAFIGRKVWPYLFHRDGWRKLLAWAGCGGWLILLVGWNLLAAHFRDAKAMGIENPESQALALFAAHPLTLASIYSYGLLLLGFIFGAASAAAGFKMDDPYPGYGPIYRRHEARCDDYADEIEDAFEELQEIRDSHIALLESVRDQLRIQFAERGQITEARKALVSRFDAHQDYLETVGRRLLDRYRDGNRAVRSTPAPAHFEDPFRLGRASLPSFTDPPSIETEVERAQASLAQSIQTISHAYNEALQSFESLDHIKASLTNG